MISVQELGVEFAARPLFSDATFIVGARDRIALVGKNGAGKSTLLKILAGQQQPTHGTVTIERDATVGYLPQVMRLTDHRTVREEAMTAFEHITELRAEVERMERELADRTDYETEDYMRLVEQFAQRSEYLSMIGASGMEGELERTLGGLGFERTDLDRPTSEFSGGWRMRIELAKLLLMRPDVLLLDEPTNHLDIESIQWLEQFLANRAGAVILVSHDRAFINNVTNRTLDITCGHIIDYKVTFDEYVRLRAERREQQLRAYENQQKEIADTKQFIDRFRYQASKAIQVQQRIRQLEKMQIIEVDEVDNSALNLRFPPCQRSGDFPIICDEVGKAFGEHRVFGGVNLTIRRGEKVAFVGRNGEGKTTLVRCIMRELEHDGRLTVGHNIDIGYFAQNQAQLLDGEFTVFDTIDRIAKGDIRTRLRDLLASFMFRGEDIDKYVKVLSGGERTRLAMIKLLLQPVNLLILDEPTNHLDLRSKDVLKEAIKKFDGTAIIVSHDREFLDGLVTKVYEFGGGKVREHLGGIYDYLRTRGIANLQELERSTSAVTAKEEAKAGATGGKEAYKQQKEAARKRRALEKAVEEAECAVMELESATSIVESQMATPEGASDAALFERYSNLKRQLAQAEAEWAEAVERLEESDK
ncbi:MAG: ABC-F family ATP-binding cassette domain-containing protein [Bacteroidaceae bacterium]|nr:ABC-F family ATP-binding cassette domain-containing protein [Bacteroidaceae bacterium]